MKYKFTFKRGWRKKTFLVVGHAFNRELNRLTLYFEDGGLREIPEWSKCECILGSDWALAVKKDMEKKSGQAIPVDRNLDAK